MNRGDRREPIFQDEADRLRFVETPRPNLVAGMKWFLGTYTGRFNRRHKRFGHLFSGSYKALVVDGSGSGYLRSVCDYVHLNPARAKRLAARLRAETTMTARWIAECLGIGSRGYLKHLLYRRRKAREE